MHSKHTWRIQEWLYQYARLTLLLLFITLTGMFCGIRAANVQGGGYLFPSMKGDFWIRALRQGKSALWDYVGLALCSVWAWTFPGSLFIVARKGFALGIAVGTLANYAWAGAAAILIYVLPSALISLSLMCAVAAYGFKSALKAAAMPYGTRGAARWPMVLFTVGCYITSLAACLLEAWLGPYAVAWLGAS